MNKLLPVYGFNTRHDGHPHAHPHTPSHTLGHPHTLAHKPHLNHSCSSSSMISTPSSPKALEARSPRCALAERALLARRLHRSAPAGGPTVEAGYQLSVSKSVPHAENAASGCGGGGGGGQRRRERHAACSLQQVKTRGGRRKGGGCHAPDQLPRCNGNRRCRCYSCRRRRPSHARRPV